MKHCLIISLIFCFAFTKLSATTWDEPWADKIISTADSFVFAEVVPNNADRGVAKIKILKHLAGDELPSEIVIGDYYLLNICSSSGRLEPFLNEVEKSYFFIHKNKKGEYAIATPTSGYDYIEDGNVYATYRHSYHMASIPTDVYELTMTAIFNHYKNLPYDKDRIRRFVDEQLSKKPAGFEEEEISTFFLQHVALETIFHLRLDGYCNEIVPFFNDSTNFHNRVSAARAFITCNDEKIQKLLLDKIADNDNDFIAVMCVRTLQEFVPKHLSGKLKALAENAPATAVDFDGGIMDPRICTSLPSVKAALEKLIEKLN